MLRSRGYDVVGQAGTAREAIDLARQHRPTILLTELSLPDRSGIAVCQALQAFGLTTSVIAVSKRISLPLLILAIRAGMVGFIWKQEHPLEWVIANIRAVEQGISLLPPGAARIASETHLSPDEERLAGFLKQLTPREIEIVGQVARGLTNAAIAAELSISRVTVRNHLVRIMNKLGVNSRVQIATLATSAGWVLPSDSAE